MGLPRRRFLVQVALLVSTLAVLFGPGLWEHVQYAADPWHFNDDARQQIWPFLRHADPTLFTNEHVSQVSSTLAQNRSLELQTSRGWFGSQGDYVADYFLATFPRGFRTLYELGAAFMDPRTLSKVLPFVELLVVLYSLIASAWRLAGPAAAWGTGALCLSADIYLARMSGGLPRSFAFPLVAMAVLALVRGKPWRLCALVVLGAACYLPVAATLGFIAATYLFLIPPSWQGDAESWSWRRRLGTLVATALAAAVVAMPPLVAGRAYGPLIDRGDLGEYPEAWQGGRYADADLPLTGLLTGTVVFYAEAPVLPHGPPWDWARRKPLRRAERRNFLLTLYWAVIVLGAASLLADRAAARRLLSVIVGAFAFYAVSFAAWPWLYLPARSLTYTLPLLTPVALPAAIASLAGRWRITRAPYACAAMVVGLVAFLVLVFGARAPGHAGITIDVPAEMRPLYEQIARLPPSSLIAGWPDDAIDDVPYLTGRRILVGFEIHQVFHKGYADEMRRRVQALIDAYFARDQAPLRRLKADFGVTHLLVNREHYGRRLPRYFKPFDEMIAKAARDMHGQPETLRQAPSSGVIEVGPFVLLDLDRIAER